MVTRTRPSHWFQFSIRTLFECVAVGSLFFALYHYLGPSGVLVIAYLITPYVMIHWLFRAE